MKPPRLTRRHFLRTSVLTSGGLWVAPSLLPSLSASATSKVNVACIGIGGRGRANLNALRGQNIVALCDVDDQRAGDAYEKFSKAKKYQDYRKMFDELGNQIDAVVVNTPDHTHFHPSVWALEHGKHLYCEKPMAHNVWEARRMTELARAKKVATQLGVQRHTIDNVHRVVELVQSGAIGRVTEVHAWIGGNRGMPADPKDFPPVPPHLKWDLWLGPAADRPYSPAYCPYNWRFWWDFGTGETGNWGCHILDIPFWALGLTSPTHVEASGPEVDPQKTPKSLASKLEFPAAGNRGPITLHWHHGTPPILEEKGLSGKGANNVFIGTEGILVCGFGSRKLYPEEKFKDYTAPDRFIPNSPGFYNEWIQAIQGGQPATCHFDYAGPMAETVLLANVAYRAGGGFDWDTKALKTVGNNQAQALIRESYRKGWEV